MRLFFNVSKMREGNVTALRLSKAELNFRIMKPNIDPETEERVELYGSQGGRIRFLGYKVIENHMNEHWISYDVTEALKSWLQGQWKEGLCND